MSVRSITTTGQASFRTTTTGGARKALIQIDERCNLHCAHCFVSATKAGSSMPYDDIVGLLIPRLTAARVERVTLTGGEPTIHPQFTGIVRALRSAGLQIGHLYQRDHPDRRADQRTGRNRRAARERLAGWLQARVAWTVPR